MEKELTKYVSKLNSSSKVKLSDRECNSITVSSMEEQDIEQARKKAKKIFDSMVSAHIKIDNMELFDIPIERKRVM